MIDLKGVCEECLVQCFYLNKWKLSPEQGSNCSWSRGPLIAAEWGPPSLRVLFLTPYYAASSIVKLVQWIPFLLCAHRYNGYRLLSDLANPIRFSENHKLARSITNTGMAQFHMPLQLLKRTLGPKINNSLYTVIRKSRKMSPFLFSARVLKYNLNLGCSTFVAKKRQLRLVKS